jgi:HSP20 family protein
MNDTATKVAVKMPEQSREAARGSRATAWGPFDLLRREVDRLFEDFDHGLPPLSAGRSLFDVEPLWRRQLSFGSVPAMDIVERDQGFEVSAELPGMEPANIDVKLANGILTISGEKKEEREEKRKNSYLSERRYGSFERSLRVPDGVDAEKIEANFSKGVLTVKLPKSAQAQKNEKKIAVKVA